MKGLLIYWWNVAPLCLCSLTFLLTSFHNDDKRKRTSNTPLVPMIMRILAAISLLRACYFAAVLAWPDVDYTPPVLAVNLTGPVVFNATHMDWRHHGGEIVCELVWQAGAVLLFSLFIFISSAWLQLVEEFKMVTMLADCRSAGSGQTMLGDAEDYKKRNPVKSIMGGTSIRTSINSSYSGGEMSLIAKQTRSRPVGLAVRIWAGAVLTAAIVQIIVFVLSLVGLYGMRGILFLDVLLYAAAGVGSMISLTICSRNVLVILDRVNVCGGPTAYRMKTVRRFAYVCNTFLTATIVVGALQLCALSRFFYALSRYWGAIRAAKAIFEMAFSWLLFYLLNSGHRNRRSVVQRLQQRNISLQQHGLTGGISTPGPQYHSFDCIDCK